MRVGILYMGHLGDIEFFLAVKNKSVGENYLSIIFSFS